ncbi:MAG TPA: YbhN family protein [Gaiellaceae bacterium]|nr:YbhN family protein [Gaiellaceae bacterium]
MFVAASALAMLAAVGVADAAGLDRVARVTSGLEPTWLLACLAGELVGYVGYVLALRNVARLDGGPRLPFKLAARTVVAGFGVHGSAHAAGGFAVDYWALRRFGLGRDQAIARVAGLGLLEYAVLAPAALAAALALLAGSDEHVQLSMTVPWLLVVPGFAVALWVSVPRRWRRLSAFARRGRGRPREALAHAVAGLGTLRSLCLRPLHHAPALFGVAFFWLGDITCLWAALKTYSVEVSAPALVLAYATGYVASRRSLPAGGAGVVEVLMTFALVWVGVPLAPALVGVLVYRLFNFWLPIVPALAALPTVRDFRLGLHERQAPPVRRPPSPAPRPSSTAD